MKYYGIDGVVSHGGQQRKNHIDFLSYKLHTFYDRIIPCSRNMWLRIIRLFTYSHKYS